MTGRQASASGAPAGTTTAPSSSGVRLRVDPVLCAGVALCARIAPAAVDLDRWGYPIVATRDLTPGEQGAARRAIRACPRRALWLD